MGLIELGRRPLTAVTPKVSRDCPFGDFEFLADLKPCRGPLAFAVEAAVGLLDEFNTDPRASSSTASPSGRRLIDERWW